MTRRPVLERRFLVERHLISQHHAFGKGPRGAVIARREFFTAMINEEDHLRLQVLKAGCQLPACIEQIDRIDDMIEQKVEYAFSPQYGYLTACPTNLGTGIRVSVMLHLPALKMTGQIEKFLNAAKAMGMAVRGLFGEGTEAAGDFYQLSNQITLGVSEKDIVSRFEKTIIPEIVEYEHAARSRLLSQEAGVLDDKISRAIALLKNAQPDKLAGGVVPAESHSPGAEYAQASGGLNAGNRPALFIRRRRRRCRRPQVGLSIATVNRLFLLTLPAHLQINYGKELDSTHRDALRAQIIRSALNG